MIAWAASRNRCTRCSARSFAALVDRSTARCFQAGSSISVLTRGLVSCAMGRTLLDDSGSPRADLLRVFRATARLLFSFFGMLFRLDVSRDGKSRATSQVHQRY